MSVEKKDKAPNAAANGVTMSGLILQSFPHSGLGSLTGNIKTEITARPIAAPIDILLSTDAGLICCGR